MFLFKEGLSLIISLLGDFLSILIQISYFPWLAFENFEKMVNGFEVTNDR